MPRALPPPPPPAAFVTSVTLVASGDVSDYTPSVRDAIVASFATRAEVSPSAISLTITSASVRIVVSIASTLRSSAEALGARLAPILASASSASALLPAGFVVTQTPTLEVTETGGGGGGAADSDMGAIIGGAVGGGVLVLVCVIFMAARRAKIRDIVITIPEPKQRQRQRLAHIRSARNKQIAGTLTDRLDRISNGEAEDVLAEIEMTEIEMTGEIEMTDMPAPLSVGFELELLDDDEHTVLCTLPVPVGVPTEIGRDSLGLSDFKRISRTQLIITANGGDGCTIQRAGIHPSYCTPSTGASPQAIERGSSVDVALGSILYLSHLKERGFLYPVRVVQAP